MLYAGLMLTADGPKVLEFNCRFGDPETQAVLPRLKSDLLAVMMATAGISAHGTTSSPRADIEWDRHACVGVVVASGGYPGLYNTGHPIHGLDAVDRDALVFHAGTRPGADGKTAETAGGRVLTVAALGHTVADARRKAYHNAARIHFDGAFYRRDIAEGV
jgi:phosphoribosylamine--glycine ligase